MTTYALEILGQYRRVLNYVWDVDGLVWIPEQQPVIEGTITGLTVNQGTAGSDPWSVEFLTPQAVTGPLTDTQLRASAVPISAATLPLPTGAATAALQTQPGVDIGDVTINNASGAGAVNIQDGGNSITVDGSVTANAGTNLNTSALALEAGHLATIDTKVPALGQALAASSVPVVLTAAQLSTLTPPAAITGFATSAKQDTGNTSLASIDTKLINPLPVSGTITAITNPVSTKTDLTPSAPTAASVGVTSASAVAANANRKGLVLVNTSINNISLGFGSTAVLNSGITLYPGGTFQMDEGTFDLGAVNAIASGASSNLTIQEYTT